MSVVDRAPSAMVFLRCVGSGVRLDQVRRAQGPVEATRSVSAELEKPEESRSHRAREVANTGTGATEIPALSRPRTFQPIVRQDGVGATQATARRARARVHRTQERPTGTQPATRPTAPARCCSRRSTLKEAGRVIRDSRGSPAMTDRISRTMHQNASQFTQRYRPHVCKAGVCQGAPCHLPATRGGKQRSSGVTPDHSRPAGQSLDQGTV